MKSEWAFLRLAFLPWGRLTDRGLHGLYKHPPSCEVVSWLAQATIVFAHCLQIPLFWYSFWSAMFLPHHATRFMGLALWCAWSVAFWHGRAHLKERIESLSFSALVHGEIMAAVSTLMTLLANVTSYYHRPGPLLFDVGFQVLPAIGPDSPLFAASDAMTIAPVIGILVHGVVHLDRMRRTQLW
jgi:hypothetical protein